MRVLSNTVVTLMLLASFPVLMVFAILRTGATLSLTFAISILGVWTE